MGRNSSKATSKTVINTTNKEDTNMNVLTMVRPVITAAFDASDKVAVTAALEAAFYPVDDTMSGGYALESALNTPETDTALNAKGRARVWLETYNEVTSRCIYNPEYAAATPHYVKNAFPVVPVVADLLAPYFGKSVTMSYQLGIDPATNQMAEMGFGGIVDGKDAKRLATAAANKTKLPVVLKCADTQKVIFVQFKDGGAKSTATRVARVSGGTTAMVAKGATPEEIAERQEAARIAAEQAAEAARIKAEEIAEAARVKAALAAQKAEDKALAEISKNAAKALKANRTAPDFGTDNYAIFESLKKVEGATCKELNFEHDERNGNPYGTSNRGWKQIAQKLAITCNHDLHQSVRDCNHTTSVHVILTPAFKLVSKGEEGGAGWYNITPNK